MNHPQSNLEGGSDSWKGGELQRHLKPIRLAQLASGSSGNAESAYRVVVQGLCDQLTVHIAVGVVTGNPSNNQDPILPSQYPATPGNMQLTPIVANQEMPKLYLREVFQDPTLTSTDNANHPLPEDIPFGWSFEPEGADEVRVDVVIPQDAWEGTALDGTLVCAVTISYTGAWTDPKAAVLALGRVRINPAGNSLAVIGTGGL